MREDVDRRMIAAVRCVDATTGTTITAPLDVRAEGVRLVRNRAGIFVITEAPGFAAYTAAFVAPPAVAPRVLTLTVRDPAGGYLPRSARVAASYLPRSVDVPVPRDIDPDHRASGMSVWAPVDVLMFPSPTAAIGVGWAVLRLTVQRQGSAPDDPGLPFAYIRVERDSDGAVLATGLADQGGEAMVPVLRVPSMSWSTSATSTTPVVTTVPVHVTAYHDATAFDAAAGRYPDPDRLDSDRATLPHSPPAPFELASGQPGVGRLFVPPPP